MATDTTTARVPIGSYILNEGATKTFPFMKEVASMFRADSEDMANSLGAVLTNGETYIPPDGVEAIGVKTLEMMNETPKEGATYEIDRLIAMNTLKNMKLMYGGGEVKPTAYRGGGMVEDNLMGMMGGGMAKKKKGYGYQDGGVVDYLSNYISDMGDGMTGFQQIVQAPKESGGFSYYLGEAQGPSVKQNQRLARKMAMEKMQNAPQDSIPAMLVDSYFQQQDEGEDKKKGSLMKLLGFKGMQEGGEVMFPPQPADPFQIDKRQADPSMYEGSVLGGGGMEQNPPQIDEIMANPEMYVDAPTDPLLLESEILEEEMMQNQMMQEDLVADRARKALEYIRLMGVLTGASEALDSPDGRSGFEITPRRTFKGRVLGDNLQPAPFFPER
tara:strand:- start:17865 stop:19022 length:1158 start_codon:yes stop_codon:yes gene_type:complete